MNNFYVYSLLVYIIHRSTQWIIIRENTTLYHIGMDHTYTRFSESFYHSWCFEWFYSLGNCWMLHKMKFDQSHNKQIIKIECVSATIIFVLLTWPFYLVSILSLAFLAFRNTNIYQQIDGFCIHRHTHSYTHPVLKFSV